MNESKASKGLIRRLQGWSWTVYCILLICAIVPFVTVGRLVLDDLKEFQTTGRRDGISMTDNRKDDDWTLPTSTVAEDDNPAPEGSKADAPIHCFTEQDRRKAAAALARAGDLPNALALLNGSRTGQELSKSAANAAVATMKHALPGHWKNQVQELRTYWSSLNDKQKQALFVTKTEVKAASLTLVLRTDADDVSSLAEALPESLAYAALVNLHSQLATDLTVPSIVIELYLDTLFVNHPTAKGLYWRGDKKPVSYSKHLDGFCSAINAYELWPHLQRMAETAQGTYRMGDADYQAWHKYVWGKRFCVALKNFDLSAADAYRTFPWRRLKPDAQRLWADKLYRVLERDASTATSPAVVAANPWLSPVKGPLNHSYSLSAVRSYPGWQLALRRFDYSAAQTEASTVLAMLHAARFYVRPTKDGQTIVLENLLENLNLERKAVISKRFPWLALIAELGGIGNGVPAYVRKAWGRKPVIRHGGKKWTEVSPREVLAALTKLSSHRGADKRFFKAFIPVYAENRNVRLDRKP